MNTRPRVLMLTTQLGYGGAETSFIRLANHLSHSMDVTVALFTPDYGTASHAKGHETLHARIVLLDEGTYIPGRFRRWWKRLRALRHLKKQHDVTISFLSGPNILNGIAGYNRGTVISLRGSRKFDPVSSVWQRRFFQYLLDPIAYRLAARIVPVSAGLGNEIASAGGRRALAKTQVISPFVTTATLSHRAHEEAPLPYRDLKSQPVIAAAGRLSVEKGFQHLIPVFAEVAQQHPGAKLLLIGDGPLMAELRGLCAHNGLGVDDTTPGIPSVIFTGYQANPVSLLALSTVFALSSATEGFPNVVLEAMAAGIPVVAADAPWGARAIIAPSAPPARMPYPTLQPTPSEYGILMPPIHDTRHHTAWAQMLGECLSTPVWHETYSHKAREHVQRFDITAVGPQWETLIHQLMGKAP